MKLPTYINIIFSLTFFCLSSINCRHKNESKLTLGKKQEIINTLNNVYDTDQKDRQLVIQAIDKYGIKSEKVKQLAKSIGAVDSSNIITVKKILEEYGWLSSKIIGEKANSALYLVIQHSTTADRKHFLPLMRVAVKNRAASAKDLAFLEDRVATDEGKKQIYGTQIGFDEKLAKYYVLPIENPKQVDEKRLKAGLIPIAEYLSQWNIKWEKASIGN